jgi:hypothetical protein
VVPPRSGRITRVPPYSRICISLPVRGYHPLWPLFPKRSGYHLQTTGLIRFRSPLLAESLLMSFPLGTEMFQFPRFASLAGYTLRCGFPHSDIHGSTGARPSPQLFAACHVLHRLLAPRHPPNALTSTLDCFSSLHFTHAQRRHQTMSSVGSIPWTSQLY